MYNESFAFSDYSSEQSSVVGSDYWLSKITVGATHSRKNRSRFQPSSSSLTSSASPKRLNGTVSPLAPITAATRKPQFLSSDLADVLHHHALVVTMLSARCAIQTEIRSDDVKTAADQFEAKIDDMVGQISDVAPLRGAHILTQMAIHEGREYREEQTQAEITNLKRENERLQMQVDQLKSNVEDREGEIQLLKEGVIDVQTKANKQFLELQQSHQQTLGELKRQAAEVQRLSRYCDHLRRTNQEFESKNARLMFTANAQQQSQLLIGNNNGMGAIGSLSSMPSSNDQTPRPTTAPASRLLMARSPKKANINATTTSPAMTPTQRKAHQRLRHVRQEASGGTVSEATASSPLNGGDDLFMNSVRNHNPVVTILANPLRPTSTGSRPKTAPAHRGAGGLLQRTKRPPPMPTQEYVDSLFVEMLGIDGGDDELEAARLPLDDFLAFLAHHYDDMGDPSFFSRLCEKHSSSSGNPSNGLLLDKSAVFSILLQLAKL